jgi:hypothetical protein
MSRGKATLSSVIRVQGDDCQQPDGAMHIRNGGIWSVWHDTTANCSVTWPQSIFKSLNRQWVAIG